jgi:hypothetical protein
MNVTDEITNFTKQTPSLEANKHSKTKEIQSFGREASRKVTARKA